MTFGVGCLKASQIQKVVNTTVQYTSPIPFQNCRFHAFHVLPASNFILALYIEVTPYLPSFRVAVCSKLSNYDIACVYSKIQP